MPLTDPDLWNLIESWPLPYREERDDSDPPKRLCTQFEHNLRKIGDWTDEASVRITEAYRRFLYLKALSGGPITPPKCIDDAWHLHLGFTDNYAALEGVVGKTLVHRTDLSKAERIDAYDLGRGLWAKEFDEEVRGDLWPSRTQKRKNRMLLVLALVCAVAWAVYVSASRDWDGELGSTIAGGALILMFCMLFWEREDPNTVSRCG